MKNLQLSLKTKWFNLTKDVIKTEDYREINDYWCRRFFNHKQCKLTLEEIVRYIKNYKYYGYGDVNTIFTYHDLSFNSFDTNTMTLGDPKKTDTERILVLEHKGITIDYGKPEWGAEGGKLYFVIKHGEIIN
jgi:hypothetical protein